MLILPYGLKDAPASRFPWVSLTIGVACIATFLFAQPGSPDSDEVDDAARPFFAYWREHPYLIPPQEIARLIGPKRVEEAEQERTRIESEGKLPDSATLTAEGDELVHRFDDAMQLLNGFSRRWGLVPSRGLAQPGWLTSMFLHADIVHLAGNLLFFSIVAASVESLVGSWVFLLFYLAAGVLSGAAQVLLEPSSQTPIIGASGAIAACMGLFTVRFATRHVKILLVLFWFARKVLAVPAWMCGGLWGARQLFELLAGGGLASGIAVGAHVGGFIVGAGVAVMLSSTSLQKSLTRPIGDNEKLWHKDLELEAAKNDLDAGRLGPAERAFTAVLERRPTSADAMTGLARVRFLRGDVRQGSRLLDKVLAQWLAPGHEADFSKAVRAMGLSADPSLLRTSVATRVALELEPLSREHAIAAYGVAAAGGSIKAAERLRQLDPMRAAAPVSPQPSAPPLPPPRPAPAPPASVLFCRLVQFSDDRATLEDDSQQPFTIAFHQIRAISVVLVTSYVTEREQGRDVLVLNLHLSSPDGAAWTLRIPSHLLGLPAGSSPRAFNELVARIATGSRAPVSPDLGDLRNERYPRFDTLQAVDATRAA